MSARGKCQANQGAWVTLEEGEERVPSRGWEKCQCSAGKVVGAGWVAMETGPGLFSIVCVMGATRGSLRNLFQLSVENGLEASMSECGGVLPPGNKGSESRSGFYELHSRFIPGPWGEGEAPGLSYCYLVSWGWTERADWELPNFSSYRHLL